MKTLLTLSIFLTISLGSFAKTYYTYTAKANGNFSDVSIWTKLLRNDGVQEDKFIISNTYTVIADDAINDMGLNDVDVEIFGILELDNSAVIKFSGNSKIEVMGSGSIKGNGNSQQIFIGSDLKYIGNKNKTISGLFFADKTTGIAPAGFKAFTLLALSNETKDAVKKSSFKLYASNKTLNIEFPQTQKSAVSVKVLNVSGGLMMSQTLNNPSVKSTVSLNNLPAGIYVVTVSDSKNLNEAKKFFIN